jgi:hypothetical protein
VEALMSERDDIEDAESDIFDALEILERRTGKRIARVKIDPDNLHVEIFLEDKETANG